MNLYIILNSPGPGQIAEREADGKIRDGEVEMKPEELSTWMATHPIPAVTDTPLLDQLSKELGVPPEDIQKVLDPSIP